MKISLLKTSLLALVFMVLNLLFVNDGFSQTTGDYRSAANTSWNVLTTWQRWDGATWVTPAAGEGYPGQNTIPAAVTIRNNNNVILNVSPPNSIGSLIIEAGNQPSTLSFAATNSLTVDGAIIINSGTGALDNKVITVAQGTLSCASVSMAATPANNIDNALNVSTGTITVTGSIIMAGTALQNAVTISGPATLNIGDALTGGNLATAVGSTVNYNGASQIVRAVTYNGNLILSGSGNKDLTGVNTIDGDFTLSGSASATAAADIAFGSSVILESGTTFTGARFTHTVGADWIINGATIIPTGSSIIFIGGDQNVGGSASTTFDNLLLSGFGTKTFSNATTINGNLSIDFGVVADLGTITTHTANTLTLGGNNQTSGTWGSSTSTATNIEDTYFAATTGFATVAAANFYSIATGNWNDNNTWSFSSGGATVGAGVFPVAGDIVNIEGGFTVTVTANAACASLAFEDAGGNNTLTINPGTTLDVSGAITIPRAATNPGNILAVGAGTLNAGSITFINGGTGVRHRMTIWTGTVTVTGDMTTDVTGVSASIIFSGAGTLNAGIGILTTTTAGGTLTTVAGSTVNYNGAAQTVKPVVYNGNLTLSGSGIKTLTGVATIGGGFQMSGSAIAAAAAALTIGGVVTLDAGTTFTAGVFTHNVAGNWINNGATFINTGSTINLNRAGIQSIGGSSSTIFNNLTLATSGAKTFSVATTVNGNLSITGTAVANLGTITTHSANALLLGGVNQLSGTWGSTTSAAININNTFFAATTGLVTVATATFYSRATGNWNTNTTWSLIPGGVAVGSGIFPGASDNVVITNGFNVTVTANAACSTLTYIAAGVNNTVTINTGITLTVSGAITIPRANAGFSNTLSVGPGTLNAGSVAFTAGGANTRHRITISTGTVTVSGNVTQVGSTGSALIAFSGPGLLQLGGTFLTAATATFTTGTGTVEYNGAAQAVGDFTYNNLTLSGSGDKTITGVTTIGGNYTMAGSATTTAVAALAIGGTVTLGAGTGFTAGAFTHTVSRDWVNNGGTFTNDGSTITFNRAGVQNIGGSASTTFNNLILSTSGIKTLSVGTFVDGNLSVTGTAVANLSSIVIHTTKTLTLGPTGQLAGTYGGATSAASNISASFATATGILTVASNPSITYFTRTSGNWNSGTTWSTVAFGNPTNAGSFPVAGDVVNIGGSTTITVTADAACTSLSYQSGTNNTNTVTINPGITLAVSGGVTIARSNTGFVNTLAVGDGTLTAASVAFTNGGVGVRHLMTIGTGTVTLSGNVTQGGSTGSASITFTGAGLLQLGGTIWSPTNGTLTTVAGSTVEYNGTAQTVQTHNYLGNLTLSGSGTKTLLAGTTSIGQNLTLRGTASTTTVVGLSISGNLDLGDGTTFTVAGFPLTVTGSTNIGGGTNGQLTISSATGLKRFEGLVTISNGATWTNNTANSLVNFRGGLTNNGTFLAGTGVHSFDTNSQNLFGTLSIPRVTVTGAVSLTNNNGLTINTALSGTGGLTQATNAILNLGGTVGITTLNAASAGNTVNYSGITNQTIKATQYANLSLNGTTASGIASSPALSTISVSGNWVNNSTGTTGAFTGFNPTSGTVLFNGTTTISGTSASSFNVLTITGTLTSGTATIHVGGDLTNTGVFNHNNGTVDFNGTIQSISGTSTTNFNNVTISNTSGTVSLNTTANLTGTLSLPLPTSAFDADGAGSGVLTLISTSAALAGSIGVITTPGNFSGNVTVQRHMGTAIVKANRYISMPVTGRVLNTDLSELNLTSGGFYYNEASAGIQNLGWIQTPSTYAFQSGRGFVTYNSPVSWEVRGPLTTGSNQGDVSFNSIISYTSTSGGPTADGWNLIGNPYPSAINWSGDVNDWTKSVDISPVVYVPDVLTNQFIVFNYTDNSGEGGIIALGQAFWIKANAINPTLTLHEPAKTSTGTARFYRKSTTSSSEQLVIGIQNEKYQDKTYLKINENATDDFDHDFDGYKLFNKSLNIYLSDDAQRGLVMHTVSAIPENKPIAVVVDAMEPGDYEISFKNAENFSAASSLFLIDRLEDKAMPVTSGESYEAHISEASQAVTDRFYLSRNPEIPTHRISDWVQAYPNPVKDKLKILIPSRENASVKLMDNSGRVIVSTLINGSFEIDMQDYPEGMYVLNVVVEGEVVVKKIIR